LKAEWTNRHKYQSFKEAELSVFEYIEGWYNVRRRHSALGYMRPNEFEKYLLTENWQLNDLSICPLFCCNSTLINNQEICKLYFTFCYTLSLSKLVNG
jgi:Integrase core domain